MISLTRIRKSMFEKGAVRSLQSILSVIDDLCFEKIYRLDTAEIVRPEEMDISDESRRHSKRYQPTRVRHFRQLMEMLELPTGSVFVDLGSGKGRVLLLASEYRFDRVVGVEISRQLCGVARSNVSLYESRSKRHPNIVIIETDVLEYDISDDENIFFLFKPFDSVIMGRVIEKIKASQSKTPRDIWLIFNGFSYDDLMGKDSGFQRLTDFAYGGTEFVIYITNTKKVI